MQRGWRGVFQVMRTSQKAVAFHVSYPRRRRARTQRRTVFSTVARRHRNLCYNRSVNVRRSASPWQSKSSLSPATCVYFSTKSMKGSRFPEMPGWSGNACCRREFKSRRFSGVYLQYNSHAEFCGRKSTAFRSVLQVLHRERKRLGYKRSIN
jgi:hypothetical protein